MNFNELLFDKKTPGEYELKRFLRNRGYIVDDVTQEPKYWYQDIDFLVTPSTPNIGEDVISSIEVKWDKRLAETGNLFLETENPRSLGGNGWFNFCQAEYLAYGDATKRIFYFFKMSDLRNYIDGAENDLSSRRTWDGSKGYVIPLRDVSALIINSVRV